MTDGLNNELNSKNRTSEVEEIEIQEWLSSLEYVLKHGSTEQARKILQQLQIRAQEAGVTLPFVANTPYVNTIPVEKQPSPSTNPTIHPISTSLSC